MAFELKAREYLKQYQEIPHEWRQIHDASGGRTDLVCWPGTEIEVFASLEETKITIGSSGSVEDFESFGRDFTDEELANEAWDSLVKRIQHTCDN